MQGEPGVDYDDSNLNPLVCDLCKNEVQEPRWIGRASQGKTWYVEQ